MDYSRYKKDIFAWNEINLLVTLLFWFLTCNDFTYFKHNLGSVSLFSF
jgi:hypothetical protein